MSRRVLARTYGSRGMAINASTRSGSPHSRHPNWRRRQCCEGPKPRPNNSKPSRFGAPVRNSQRLGWHKYNQSRDLAPPGHPEGLGFPSKAPESRPELAQTECSHREASNGGALRIELRLSSYERLLPVYAGRGPPGDPTRAWTPEGVQLTISCRTRSRREPGRRRAEQTPTTWLAGDDNPFNTEVFLRSNTIFAFQIGHLRSKPGLLTTYLA